MKWNMPFLVLFLFFNLTIIYITDYSTICTSLSNTFSKMYINVRDTQSDVIKIKLIEQRLERYNIILMVHGKYNFHMTTYVELKI